MLGHPVQVCRRVTSCSAGICIQLAAVPLRSNPHSKYIQGPLQAPATAYRRPAARHSSTTVCRVTPSPTPPSSKLKRSIWTAVDVAALLGSVGGALAALLGVVSPTYALTLPLVLPVVSLIAALQREDLSNEEGRLYLSELSNTIGRDSTALLREAAAAIEEVRREARSQSAAAARLAAIEDKLAVLEGAVVGAARSSREAAMGVNALGSALSQTLQQSPGAVTQSPIGQQNAQMLAGYVAGEVVPLVKAELASSLGPWLADNSSGLKRLDTRLAVVEGSVAGLEMAQSEGLRRLSGSINSSLVDAESALQSAVRIEVATAVEPLKQLPQLVAAAAAKAAAAQQQQQQQRQQLQLLLPGGVEGDEAAAAVASPAAAVDQTVLLQQRQELVAAEVAAATQQILNQQAEVLAALSQPPRPSPLAEDQWEALGRRLARLERLVQSVPELGEQAVAGQIAPLIAAQQAQQAAVEPQATAVAAAMAQLSAAAGQMSESQDRLARLLAEFEALQARLDQIAGQFASNVFAPGAAAASEGPSFAAVADQLMQQLQDSVQQLLQQQPQQQPVQGFASTDLSDLLLSLQQQVQGLGAALQQVQMDIPVQIQLAFEQASQLTVTTTGSGVDVYDGSAYDGTFSSNANSAATAASAASAAAQGIAEVRQLLTGVQKSCEDLQMQVGALAAQVAAQQAVTFDHQQASAAAVAENISGSNSSADALLQAAEAAQQQLAEAASQATRDLSGQLSGLCSSLELQLLDLQQQLVAAATAAATQAATEAAAAAAAAAAVASSSAGANGSSRSTTQHHGSSTDSVPEQPGGYYEEVAAGGWAGYQQEQQQQAGVEASNGPAISAGVAANPAGGHTLASSYGSLDLQAGGFSIPDGQPGMWFDGAADTPGQTQQQQQQQPYVGQPIGEIAPAEQPGVLASAAAAGGVAAAGPRLSAPVIPDIASLSEEQLRTEGLRLLRSGREATSGTGSYAGSGPDFAAAESQLQAAVACFMAAVDSEPTDTRALGNLGNALLAQGELKKSLLDELRLTAAQGGLGFGGGAAAQWQSLELAENRLRSEAVGLLTRAGEIFRRVLEVDGWSSRALVNWGKALVGRAELAVDRSAATKLYNAAIDKFEAVLEEDPGMVVAKYRCALAMQGLAALHPDGGGAASAQAGGGQQGSGSRQRLLLLQDASSYLSDLVAAGAGGDEGLREAAAVVLRQVQEQLGMAKLS